MTEPNWEDVPVQRGAYIGWGEHVGQHVTGRVLDYDPTGGTDFAGNPCPQLSVELIEASASFNKSGERTDFAAGELVVLNAGQVSLKRALRAADPSTGDLIKITLSNLAKTANGTVKEMSVRIARGAGSAPTAKPAAAPAPSANPFAQQAAAPAANPFQAAPTQAQPPF
ncbi:MAG: hypothetical protein QM695_15960 [Micropruina sp.]